MYAWLTARSALDAFCGVGFGAVAFWAVPASSCSSAWGVSGAGELVDGVLEGVDGGVELVDLYCLVPDGLALVVDHSALPACHAFEELDLVFELADTAGLPFRHTFHIGEAGFQVADVGCLPHRHSGKELDLALQARVLPFQPIDVGR